MTNFNLDLDGEIDLSNTLDRVQDKAESDATYAVGGAVEYGKFLEFGTRNMPPYPWFRPAVRELELDAETFLRKNNALEVEYETTQDLVLAYAVALERQMKTNVSAPLAGRSAGTNPEHPRVDIGTLKTSIGFRRLR